MKDRPNPLLAPGYTKQRGAKSERNDMTVEAQHQTRFGEGNKSEAGIFIRVGVAPKPGDRPLDDLAENSANLHSTKPAHLQSGFWPRLPWRNKPSMRMEEYPMTATPNQALQRTGSACR